MSRPKIPANIIDHDAIMSEFLKLAEERVFDLFQNKPPNTPINETIGEFFQRTRKNQYLTDKDLDYFKSLMIELEHVLPMMKGYFRNALDEFTRRMEALKDLVTQFDAYCEEVESQEAMVKELTKSNVELQYENKFLNMQLDNLAASIREEEKQKAYETVIAKFVNVLPKKGRKEIEEEIESLRDLE
jgi:regulator of replication initiation timing